MLLAEGASVGLFDVIPEEKGQAFAKEISPDGKALYVRVDITDDAAVKTAVEKVVEKYGNLKGCVHCAGIALKRDWTNDAAGSIPNFKKVWCFRSDGERIDRMFDTDLCADARCQRSRHICRQRSHCRCHQQTPQPPGRDRQARAILDVRRGAGCDCQLCLGSCAELRPMSGIRPDQDCNNRHYPM